MSRRDPAVGNVAFAVSQRTPMLVLYMIVIVGVGAFSAAVATLVSVNRVVRRA